MTPFNRMQQRADEIGRRAETVLAAMARVGHFFWNAPDLCVIATRTHIVLCNKRFTDVLGYERTELEGKPWLDFVIEEDTAETAAVVVGMERQENDGSVNRWRKKGGGHVTLEWRSTQWDSDGLCYAIARVRSDA